MGALWRPKEGPGSPGSMRARERRRVRRVRGFDAGEVELTGHTAHTTVRAPSRCASAKRYYCMVRAWYAREGTSYVQLAYTGADAERAREVLSMKRRAQKQTWAS